MNSQRSLRRAGRVGALVALAAATAGAAGFIKFDGVDGEARDKDHKDWIPIESLTVEPAEDTAAPAAATGKRQHKPFILTKPVDKASPKLAEAVANGRTFRKVVVHFWDGEPGKDRPYRRYELKDVLITTVTPGGAADDRPTETLSLNYEEIKLHTVEPDDDLQMPTPPPLRRLPPTRPAPRGR